MNAEQLQQYFKDECRTSGDSVIKLGSSQLSPGHQPSGVTNVTSRGLVESKDLN